MPMTDEEILDRMTKAHEANIEQQHAIWYSRELRRQRHNQRRKEIEQARVRPNPVEPRRCKYALCKKPIVTVHDFYKDRRNKDGMDIYCKKCRNSLFKQYKKKKPKYQSRYASRRRESEGYIRQLVAHIVVIDPGQRFKIPIPPPHLCLDIDKWLTKFINQDKGVEQHV